MTGALSSRAIAAQRAWTIARRLQHFTRNRLAAAAGVSQLRLTREMVQWQRSGMIRVVGLVTRVVANGTVDQVRSFAVVPGATPAGRRPDHLPSPRERVWTAIRIMRTFTVADIAGITGLSARVVRYNVFDFKRCGAIVVTGRAQCATYRLVRDTARPPAAPIGGGAA